MKVLVHVVTDNGPFSGETKVYRLPDGRAIRSSSSLVPLALAHGGEGLDDLRILVIIPHRFLFFSENHPDVGPYPFPASREEAKEWIVRATDKLPDLYLDLLVESTRWKDGRRPDFLEELRGSIHVAVVQEDLLLYASHPRLVNPGLGGSVGEPMPRSLEFDGLSVHAYIEVLRFLDRVEPEISIFDYTGGWLSFAGVSAKYRADQACRFYSLISGAGYRFDIAPHLEGSGRRLMNDGFGSNWEGYTWEMFHPSPNQLIRELVDELVKGILSMSMTPEFMREFLRRLHGYRMRDIESYEESIRCKWRTVLRALALLGKASCAYNYGLLPYLHLNVRRIEAILEEVEEFSEGLNLKAERGDYVKDIDVYIMKGGSEVNIHYRLLPPIPLLPARALLRMARERLIPLLGGKSEPGEMRLSMVEAVLRSYERTGLDSRAEILRRELEAASGRERQEDGLGRVLEYLKELRKCKLDDRMIRRRYIYPFYVILGPSFGGEVDLCEAHRREEWMLSWRLHSSPDPRSPIFLAAQDVIWGKLRDESTLRRLAEELRAHAGICYLSVRNVLEEEGEVRILYHEKLFDGIEWGIRANRLFERLKEALDPNGSRSFSSSYYGWLDEVDREMGEYLWSLCDLLPQDESAENGSEEEG